MSFRTEFDFYEFPYGISRTFTCGISLERGIMGAILCTCFRSIISEYDSFCFLDTFFLYTDFEAVS